MRHILEAQQFEPKLIELLFSRAKELQVLIDDPRKHQKIGSLLSGHILISVFFEPSTRTRVSFESAAQHLGMSVVSTENANASSSATKGESLEDTIKVLCEYRPSIIVMRHPDKQSAKLAAKVSNVPIVNAGDGAGQHPSQALLDLYTIEKEIGRKHDLTVLIGCDLLHSRSSRSLIYILSLFKNNRLILVSENDMRIDSELRTYLTLKGINFTETNDLKSSLKLADVVYWPRIQKERSLSYKNKQAWHIGVSEMKLLKTDSILMTPLPRVDEIPPAVDKDPRAVYFKEAGNGMFIRMALLEWCLRLIG